MVYKLVAIDGRGRVKKSPGKRTYPLGKQVVRRLRSDGTFDHDLVIASDEPVDGDPLLVPVVRAGAPVRPWPDLEEIRAHFRGQRDRLPEPYRVLDCDAIFPIRYSDRLEEEARRQGLLPPG
jgi:nicotinate phosphoribosyltransferase